MSEQSKLDYGFTPEDHALKLNKAADNNKVAIFEQLTSYLQENATVLEIGSGTCQHSIYFCRQRPAILWLPTDVEEKENEAKQWLKLANLNNIRPWQNFTLGKHENLSFNEFSMIYSANTLHIMPRDLAKRLLEKVNTELAHGSKFCVYGPFKQDGQFTTESNAEFNQWLLAEGYGGMLDISELTSWAPDLKLVETVSMPANNFLLTFEK